MRDLTTEFADAITAPNVSPALFAEFLFDGGRIGMWTGYGVIEYDGVEYYGGGNLINVSQIEETQELEAKGLRVGLNGVSSDLTSVLLSQNLKNRVFRLYLGMVEAKVNSGVLLTQDGEPLLTEDDEPIIVEEGRFSEYRVIEKPYRLFSGLMDTVEFADDGNTADISLSVENILIVGQRAKVARYTDEEQRKRFPDDKGLEFINRLQDRDIVW